MSKNSAIQVGICQLKGNNGDASRFPFMQSQIRAIAAKGAQIVVLPELVFTDYFCIEEHIAHFDLAQATDHPQILELGFLAKELKIVLVIPFFERHARGIYFNSATVFDADGKNLGLYRKMHIPDDPGFYEKYYFAPGDLGFKAFDTKYGKVGVLICWDQWFPEAARLTALQGADVIVYPTAIGWDHEELAACAPTEKEKLQQSQLDAWVTIQRSHAIANGCFVAAVNRVGSEGHLDFWGNSFVVNPRGEFLGRLDHQSESNMVVSCEWEEIEHTRKVWPFFRDRRVDAFGGLGKRYG